MQHIHSISSNINDNSNLGKLLISFKKKKEDIQNDLNLLKEKQKVLENMNLMILTTEKDVISLEKKSSFGLNTKQVNDRMTKFNESDNGTLRPIVTYLKYFHWFILIPLALKKLFSFSDFYSIGIALFVLITPLYIDKITNLLFGMNNCPTFLPSLGFDSGLSKTCQIKHL